MMQGSKLYVGNFSYSVTKEDLEQLFSTHGTITSVNVIEGRGFGFIEGERGINQCFYAASVATFVPTESRSYSIRFPSIQVSNAGKDD